MANLSWGSWGKGVKWELGFAFFRGWDHGNEILCTGAGIREKKNNKKMEMGFQFEQHRLGLWDLSWDLKKTISWEMGLGPPPSRPSKLANSCCRVNPSWCVWTAQKQAANTFANCWRQIETCLQCQLFLCRSHTPTWVCQHEFANFHSLPCEGRLRVQP